MRLKVYQIDVQGKPGLYSKYQAIWGLHNKSGQTTAKFCYFLVVDTVNILALENGFIIKRK